MSSVLCRVGYSTVIRMVWDSNHLQISVFVTTKWHDSNHLQLKCDWIWIHLSFSCDLSRSFTNYPAVPLKWNNLVQHSKETAWVKIGTTLKSWPQATPVLGICICSWWFVIWKCDFKLVSSYFHEIWDLIGIILWFE